MQIEMLKGAQHMGEMNGIIYPRWHKLTQERVLHTRQFIITIRNSSCGKVVLLRLSVILFTGGCLPLGPGGVWFWVPETATAADCTHPTGMHSCSW